MQKLYITSDENKLFLLNKLRSNNDLSSLVMSINELKKNLYFDYDEETIFYIVSNYHTTKEIATTYIETIYYLDNSNLNPKITFLNNLKKELEEKNLLTKKPLFNEWLKNYELHFYHLLFTNLTNKIFNTCSLITKTIKEELSLNQQEITYFKTLDIKDEVSNICSLIVSLIKQGIPYQNIYLANVNADYQKMFLTYGHIFNLSFSFNHQENIYSTFIIQYFLNHLTEDWNIVLSNIKKNIKYPKEEEVYNALVKFCNKYLLLEKNNEFYNYIKESLKSISLKSKEIKNSIKCFDFLNEEVDKDAYIFLVNTSESAFPNLIKNYEYLTDEDRQSLNLLSILNENKIINEETLKKLNYYPNLTLSYSAQEDNKFYPSPILTTCTLKEQQVSSNYHNSSLFNQLKYANYMDIYYEYGILEENLKDLYPTYKNSLYRSFKHDYQPFKISNPITTLSYSSLDLYNRCPFRFYLANVLKIQKSSPTFFQDIGKFYHHILQEFYEPDFNFNKLVLEEKQHFNNSTKEEFFFNKLTTNLAKVIDEIKRQESYSSLKNVLCEVKIEVPLNHNITFKGFIDKFYYDDQKIAVIDYKTGNPKIDFNLINYGIGMQLPIYAFLLSKSQFKDYELVGFYLQKVIPNLIIADLKHQKEQLESKEYYLEGYSTSNESSLNQFDSSYTDSKVIKSLKKSSKGFYSYSLIMSEEQLKQMNTFTENKINEAIEEIHQNNFSIKPINIDNKNIGCEFCPYESICNYDGLDIVYKKGIKPEFMRGEENELVNDAIASH